MSEPLPPPSREPALMNIVLRMVVPLRREFGCALDVPHFLRDRVYAREILDVARTSHDARLRAHADHLNRKLFGPRSSPAPAQPVALPPTPAGGGEAADGDAKNRLLEKYKSSLR